MSGHPPRLSVEEWKARAEEHRLAGEPLVIDPSDYAELVRLRLAHDPLDLADHTADLWGVPLVVDW